MEEVAALQYFEIYGYNVRLWSPSSFGCSVDDQRHFNVVSRTEQRDPQAA
jgi:hypothetical protein